MVACMPTAFIMALKAEGIYVVEAGKVPQPSGGYPFFVHPVGMQPEDYLMVLLRSEWGIELRNQYAWAKRDHVNPNEVHAVISEAVNKIIGMKVTKFSTGGTVKDIKDEIGAKHPVVVSGSFTGSGHAVAVVGYRYVNVPTATGEIHKITDFIIDDPYGNMHTRYVDRRGNDVKISVKQFDRLWGGFMHRFRKEGV